MDESNICRECEMSINKFRQISQEELDALKEHMDISQACEECCIAALGQIEFPD